MRSAASASLCARSQPTKSSTSALRHIHVGKRWKSASAALCVGVARRAQHVAIDAVGVGPVGLDRDCAEAFSVISRLVSSRALPVELVRSVARLADQHAVSSLGELEQRLEITGRARKAVRFAGNGA